MTYPVSVPIKRGLPLCIPMPRVGFCWNLCKKRLCKVFAKSVIIIKRLNQIKGFRMKLRSSFAYFLKRDAWPLVILFVGWMVALCLWQILERRREWNSIAQTVATQMELRRTRFTMKMRMLAEDRLLHQNFEWNLLNSLS